MSTRQKEKKVTILDVAEKSGASKSTVSRALLNHPSVSRETKEMILKVASQLGYSHSPRRPGPKPGQTNQKRMALINFLDEHHRGVATSPMVLSLQQGLKEEARENGFSIHFHTLNADEELPEAFLKEKFSGFILLGGRPHPSVEEFLRTLPCCWVLHNPWTPSWGDHVLPDVRQSGMMALEYLAKRGCRHPVFMKLGWPSRVSALRWEGFSWAASKQGVEAQLVQVENPAYEDPQAPYPELGCVDELIEYFKKTVSDVDGILFDSDRSLATLYPVMAREKIIAPGKTVLIGCNNHQPLLKGISPHPATMEIHFRLIGRLGIVQLLWRRHNQIVRQRVHSMISPTLITLS